MGWAKSSESQTSQRFADKWAVVIGVDEFSDPSWNMQYAIKDAQDFQSYLIEHAHFAKDHIKVLTGNGATREHILRALGEWLAAASQPDDLALIYIRTRGTLAELDVLGNSYLAASDTNSQKLFSTGIDMDGLPKLVLERIRAGATVMIVDADFSGIMARTKSLHWPSMPKENLLPVGHSIQVFCSAAANEISWESKSHPSSVFTGSLLAALMRDGDSATLPKTADSIADQVMQEVKDTRQRPQHPISMGMCRGPGGIAVMLALPATHPHASSIDSRP
jgi:uncharacterized caspase-like protein